MSITDGRGRWRWCRFGSGLEADGEVQTDPRPTPSLTVAFALVKGNRPELVVQKLTELGIDRITPFIAARSVVRWEPDKAERNRDRLRRVAVEAAAQSRRTWLPEIDPVVSFAEVVSRPGAAGAERDGGPPSLDRPVALIGPEGGWSDDERSQLPALFALGDGVLRAETAAIAAGTLLVALRAGSVVPRS